MDLASAVHTLGLWDLCFGELRVLRFGFGRPDSMCSLQSLNFLRLLVVHSLVGCALLARIKDLQVYQVCVLGVQTLIWTLLWSGFGFTWLVFLGILL